MRGVQTSKKVEDQIIRLRQQGNTIREIRNITGKSKSLISTYIKEIKIKPEFYQEWHEKRGYSKRRMLEQWVEAKKQINKDMRSIGHFEKMLIGACLYWGEGTKREFNLSNTDPELIKVFVECLEEFGITKERLKVSIRIYEDINKQVAINYWSKVVGISADEVCSVNILRGKKKGKLAYGMCRVRIIKGGFPLKLIKSIQQVIVSEVISPRSSMDRAPHS